MTGLPGELVTYHLHIDCLAHVVPNRPYKILVDPGFKLAHPVPLSAFAASTVPWYAPGKGAIELLLTLQPKPECNRSIIP